MSGGYPEAVEQEITKLSEHYDFNGECTKGANGYMLFATNKNHKKKTAIKFYCEAPGLAQHKEPEVLSAINSPNVLEILEARSIDEDWAYFITPFCADGDLDDLITKLPSYHSAIDIGLGICRGVGALHVANLVHRDLKPSNILMRNGKPLIGDFGSVKALGSDGFVTASKHSVLYRPPESFGNAKYSKAGDIYQVGLVMFQLLGGSLPYDEKLHLKPKQLMEYANLTHDADKSAYIDTAIAQKAQKSELARLNSLAPWAVADTRVKNLLRRSLAPDPSDRFASITELSAALTDVRSRCHDWQWVDGVASVNLGDRRLQLRQVGPELFEEYQEKNGTYRRVPLTKAAGLIELIKRRNT